MLCAILSFVALGLWQLNRLNWKRELIAKAQTNSKLPPLNSPPEIYDDIFMYRQVKLKATLLSDIKPIMIPESYKQKFYYRILAPVKINTHNILVDFGLCASKDVNLPQVINARGIIVNFDRKNVFYPKNNPAKLVWYNTDFGTLQEYLDIALEPYMIKIMPGFATNSEFVIKPFATSYRNDHLMYAVTWFVLAFFCSIVFYFRVKDTSCI